MHLMDSPLDMCEVDQNPALYDFISMIIVVHVKMNLVKLPM